MSISNLILEIKSDRFVSVGSPGPIIRDVSAAFEGGGSVGITGQADR